MQSAAGLHSNVTREHGEHQVYTTLLNKTLKSLIHHSLKVKVHKQ